MPDKPFDAKTQVFSVDEVRAILGKPPETGEEREARHQKTADRRRVAEEGARLAQEAEEARQRERAAEYDRLAASVEAAANATDRSAFQRAAAGIVPRFEWLRPAQLASLEQAIARFGNATVIGTPEEISAMSVLTDKLRQWRRGEEEREAARTRAFRVVDGRIDEVDWNDVGTDSSVPPASAPKPSFVQSLLAAFGFKRKE